MTSTIPLATRQVITDRLRLLALGWLTLVVIAAQSGALAALYPPFLAAIVAASFVIPYLIIRSSPTLRAYFAAIGLHPLTAFHVWRIPAALLFFWYGAKGDLPAAFWVLAGVGDLAAGLLALPLLRPTASFARYRFFHRFGFADFIVAVGTGLTFTLLQDPRMAAITELPLALVPFFGVGISGISHLIAFGLLRNATSAASFPIATTGGSR